MPAAAERHAEVRDRLAVLRDLEEWLEVPMLVLSFTWIVLVVVELVWGTSSLLEVFGVAIWIVFLAEFLLRIALAPDKRRFIGSNWLSAIALVAPAFRLFRAVRLLRFARAARGLRLVRIVGTANRGMNALRASLGRRGLGYVLAATLFVILLGAAGIFALESSAEVEGGLQSYGDALWWTSMLLTSIGSEYWPKTGEGRVLCFLLSVYGFAVFGYITASFASFFVGQEARSDKGDVPGVADLKAIKDEIVLLRARLEKR
jgi:voltage-gated potassium channel